MQQRPARPIPPAGPGILAIGLMLLLAGACDGGRPADHVAAVRAAAGPARRIVSLAPSLTELTYAAGAGDRLVGAVDFSNHPDAARQLPRVGDAFRVDYEAIAALHPDLILGWPSGNSARALDRLRQLGYRVMELEPRTLDDISGQILLIGELAGTVAAARPAAAQFAGELADLRSRYRRAQPVRVFFQVAPEPLITVTSRHFIGQAIETCGGINVFGALDAITPTVEREAVLTENPDVIVGSDYTAGSAYRPGAGPLDGWRQWRSMAAVAGNHLFVIDPDLLSVPSPRMLEGIGILCADLDIARAGLPQATPE